MMIPIFGFTQSDLLSKFQWKNRLVILLFDDPSNIELESQEILINRNKLAFKERDIKVLKYNDEKPEANKLRADFGLPKAGFIFLLVGKDGYKKLAREKRVMPKELFSVIDAMPMRRMEIKERKKKT